METPFDVKYFPKHKDKKKLAKGKKTIDKYIELTF